MASAIIVFVIQPSFIIYIYAFQQFFHLGRLKNPIENRFKLLK